MNQQGNNNRFIILLQHVSFSRLCDLMHKTYSLLLSLELPQPFIIATYDPLGIHVYGCFHTEGPNFID